MFKPGTFAAAWARKELVVDTEDQLAAVKQVSSNAFVVFINFQVNF